MKKLLLTLLITVSFAIQAQDGYSLSKETYQNIYTSVNELDDPGTLEFATKLTEASPTNYEFIKLKETDDTTDKVYYYLDSSLTPSEKTKALEFGCRPCLKVYFKASKDGYKFHSVIGSLEDLLPTWNAVFLSAATKETVASSFKYREVKNRDIGLDVRFTKQQGVWKIYNWSL